MPPAGARLGGVTPADPLRALLEAARDGDDAAVAELVRRTQADVWRLCTAMGSPGEEEDLVQETYLRALRSLDGFRGEAKVRSWLLAIGRNVCADHVRRRERGRRLARRTRPTDDEAVTFIDEPVEDLLAPLDRDRREAFVLTQLLGLSYEEAAEALDCPVGTIRSRVARARSQLLDLVAERRTG